MLIDLNLVKLSILKGQWQVGMLPLVVPLAANSSFPSPGEPKISYWVCLQNILLNGVPYTWHHVFGTKSGTKHDTIFGIKYGSIFNTILGTESVPYLVLY